MGSEMCIRDRVKALLVPVEQFAETRRKMETAGTAEAILYHKIKSEL